MASLHPPHSSGTPLSRSNSIRLASTASAITCIQQRWAHKKTVRCSTSAPSSIGFGYEFRDDGGELELRLHVPSDHADSISSKNVAIQAQDVSLDVALKSDRGVSTTLLSVPRLYSRIKPVETMWFIDDDEIVLSLKKQDAAQPWPGLLEAWEYLGKGVAGMLKATSIFIVGESSETNAAVAKELALALNYVPLETKKLMEKLVKTSLDEYAKTEGADAVAELECKVLETLSKYGIRKKIPLLEKKRCYVQAAESCSGDAGRRRGCSCEAAKLEIHIFRSRGYQSAAERDVYSKAETVVDISGLEDGVVRPAAEACLRALKQHIESNKDLPGNKSLYVRLAQHNASKLESRGMNGEVGKL